eukprot:g19644.t1
MTKYRRLNAWAAGAEWRKSRCLRVIDVVRARYRDVTATTATTNEVVTADELRAAETQRMHNAFHKAMRAQDLLDKKFSAKDYDKRAFLEDLQSRILRECVDTYVDRVSARTGEMKQKKLGDDVGGQKRTREQVIGNSYYAHTADSISGIPTDQYQLDGITAAGQPHYCRLLFAWKAEQTKIQKAEKAAEEAARASKPVDRNRADDGDALPSRRDKAAPAGTDKKPQTAAAAAKQKQQEQAKAILKQLEENFRSDTAAASTLKPPRPRAVLQLQPKATSASSSSSSADDDKHHYFYIGLILASSTPGVAGARLRRQQTDEGVAEWVIGLDDDAPHQMLVSHLADSVSGYDLNSAKVFEALPALCRHGHCIAFHMLPEAWEPAGGVVPEKFDSEDDNDAGPEGKKQKKSKSNKPPTDKIWSNVNVNVNAASARATETAAGADPQATGAEHKPSGASSGGAAGQQGGWETDAEKRRLERERIAKFLAENQDAGGPGGNNKKLVPGKDYNIAAATRIMKCTILLEAYWDIFYRGTAASTSSAGTSSRKGGEEAWLLFDAAQWLSAPPSSGVKQRGVKDYGDAGASALLVLWAHRAAFLARNFNGPTPAKRSPAELEAARKAYNTFCKDARAECVRLKIPEGEIDRFGAADDFAFTHLRPLSETAQGRGNAQMDVRVKHEVADDDLNIPYSSLQAPAHGVSDDFGFDDDSAGIAEVFDESIGDVADAYDVDYSEST